MQKVNKKKTICIVLFIVAVLVFGFSAYKLISYNMQIADAAETDREMLQYKPDISAVLDDTADESTESEAETVTLNEDILRLQQRNSDFIGWLNVYETNIDFAFAHTSDNEYYLYKDIDKKYSVSGSVFLDYRCSSDFSGPINILYGHHMKKAAKFSYMDAFADKSYMEQHRHLNVLLVDRYIQAKIFAYAIVPATSGAVFGSLDNSEVLLDYLKNNAEVYLENDFTPEDKLILLATCNYEISDGRAILVAGVKSR